MFALASASLHVILSDGSDSVVSFSSKIFSDYRDTKADRDNKKEDKTNFNGIIFPIHKLVGWFHSNCIAGKDDADNSEC